MKMANFTEQLQRIVEDYRAAGQPWPASTQEMAEWAVAHDRYKLARGMAVSQCASKIGRAMGLEHVRDRRGRSIRKYYAARVQRDGQLSMVWDDLNAERPFMEIAAANRRNHILGECRQLKTDIDSYNERKCPDPPIQIEFNFNVDLEELEQLDEVA
jgi:hypothetical protein